MAPGFWLCSASPFNSEPSWWCQDLRQARLRIYNHDNRNISSIQVDDLQRLPRITESLACLKLSGCKGLPIAESLHPDSRLVTWETAANVLIFKKKKANYILLPSALQSVDVQIACPCCSIRYTWPCITHCIIRAATLRRLLISSQLVFHGIYKAVPSSVNERDFSSNT